MLGFFDFLAARHLEVVQRLFDIGAADGLEGVEQRTGIFHGELGAGADGEMRRRLGVADQDDVIHHPTLIGNTREISP